MEALSKKQQLFLKKMSHHLKPVVWMGQSGLSENIFNEIDNALEIHELIKVKLAGADKETRKTLCAEICKTTNASLINSIGQMVILFRINKKQPKIVLPKI